MRAAVLFIATVFLAITCSSIAFGQLPKMPAAGTVRICFVGFYSEEPIEITVDGKTSSSKVTTGPAVPAFTETDVKVGNGPTALRLRMPHQRLERTIEINAAQRPYLYADIENGNLVIEQTAKARSFD
jgi:hypothetical protein